jgi:hypothetical protein
MNNARIKQVLSLLLDEIEDLRAHQGVTSVVLSALPDLATTNLALLKEQVLEKSQNTYPELRAEIENL